MVYGTDPDGNDTEHPGLMVDNCVKNIGGSNFYFAAGGANANRLVAYIRKAGIMQMEVEHRQSDGDTSMVLGII